VHRRAFSISCPECQSRSVAVSAVEAQCEDCGHVWDLPDDHTADYVRHLEEADYEE